MTSEIYDYVIVGSGLTGASAAQGIRERDTEGSLLLLGSESQFPYDRPPLTKQLWFGKKRLEEIFLHDETFYSNHHVELSLGRTVTAIDSGAKTVTDNSGDSYGFRKLILATGGTPRRLDIPGGDLEGICYYRYLGDYTRIHAEASEGKTAVVIGGGFIGSEIAAALCHNHLHVTMVFPEQYLVSRVFPKSLGIFLTEQYRKRGIQILSGDVPISLEKQNGQFLTQTRSGARLVSDIVIVGIGITPETALARKAGLRVENGISVNQHLQTSNPDVFAAGDNAFFPYLALGEKRRVEHWDNALNQGKCAGRNMVVPDEPYAYMPYFFSDLFEFGYEAVGEVDARLETTAQWDKENDTGIIYYLREGKIRGAMMCNVWGKVEAAREVIRKAQIVDATTLREAI